MTWSENLIKRADPFIIAFTCKAVENTFLSLQMQKTVLCELEKWGFFPLYSKPITLNLVMEHWLLLMRPLSWLRRGEFWTKQNWNEFALDWMLPRNLDVGVQDKENYSFSDFVTFSSLANFPKIMIEIPIWDTPAHCRRKLKTGLGSKRLDHGLSLVGEGRGGRLSPVFSGQ